MSTKAELLASWCRRTGDPVREARHRFRVLAEAGLLPRRLDQLSYGDIAHALLGFVAATQHKDAADAVRRFSKFRCPRAFGDDNQTPLMSLSLIEAITAALHQPLWISELSINVTEQECRLTVVDGIRPEIVSGVEYAFGGPTAVYTFLEPAQLPLTAPRLYYPVRVTRSVYDPLIGRLLTDLMDHPPLVMLGDPVSAASHA